MYTILVSWFLELIALVVIATNGIWGISEVGERNIYLIVAVGIWIFGMFGPKFVSGTKKIFIGFSILFLCLLVLTGQTQVTRDLLPVKIAVFLIINQITLTLVLRHYKYFPKILEFFVAVAGFGSLWLVCYSFDKNNADFLFAFSKNIAVRSIFPTVIALFAYFVISKLSSSAILKRLLFAAAVVGIVGVTFTATLPYNGHQNTFLAPLLKISNGGTMLVDTFSLYGVGVFYFIYPVLKFISLGITFPALSFYTNLLETLTFVGFFCLCYFIFRKNLAYSILITAISILLKAFLSIGTLGEYPSTGFLRFGLTYILAISFIVAKKYLRGFVGQIYAAVVVSIAAIWSFDTFTSTLYVFGAIQLLDFLENKSVTRIVRAFIFLGISIVAFVGLFMLFTFLRSGLLPNVVPYWAFIKQYLDGFDLLHIPTFGIWWLFLVVYAASAIWSWNNYKTESARAVFLITAVGVGILPYYVGRSHPNNLFHVGLPLVFLIGFWIWKNRYIRIAGISLLIFLAMYISSLKIDLIEEKFSTTVFGVPSVTKAIDVAVQRDRDFWYSKFPPLKEVDMTGVKYVATILPYNDTTGVLSLLGKGNLAGTGDPIHDERVWPNIEPAVLNQIDKMRAGDLYIGREDECSVRIYLRKVYFKLENSYNYKRLAKFQDLSILQVTGPKSDAYKIAGPVLTSISPKTLVRTGNLENSLRVAVTGDNLSPTTSINIGSSFFKTEYVDVNHLWANIPELLLNRPGKYEIKLSNCKGNSEALDFFVL